jgi:predicted  nucleic acid-binding Zn ribbon protein
MNDGYDVFWKLRSPPPTPANEVCSCSDFPPILLGAGISSNPICCLRCNLEVPPERLGLPEDLVEDIANWRDFHSCFFGLWLDSGEFELWAKAQLSDPRSAVNTRAIDLVLRLNHHHPTYYRWFLEPSEESRSQVHECPRCHGRLTTSDRLRLCGNCHIAIDHGRGKRGHPNS